MGRAKKHGIESLFFAVIGTCRRSVLSLAQEDRLRLGIESRDDEPGTGSDHFQGSKAATRAGRDSLSGVQPLGVAEVERAFDSTPKPKEGRDLRTQYLLPLHSRAPSGNLWGGHRSQGVKSCPIQSNRPLLGFEASVPSS